MDKKSDKPRCVIMTCWLGSCATRSLSMLLAGSPGRPLLPPCSSQTLDPGEPPIRVGWLGSAPGFQAAREARLVIDPAAVAVDEPLGPGQYRYVLTRAWWTGHLQRSGHDFSCLAENVIQVWVPADEREEWLLDRRQTGRRIWLEGSAERLARAGGGPLGSWPTGRWRAPYGGFFAAESGEQPGPMEECWQLPNSHFLAALPRDPQVLYERLRADSPDDKSATWVRSSTPPTHCAAAGFLRICALRCTGPCCCCLG